jgi:hypothetical protein
MRENTKDKVVPVTFIGKFSVTDPLKSPFFFLLSREFMFLTERTHRTILDN